MVGRDGDASPVVNIVGERVALGPLRREDVPLHHRWHNDFAIRRTLGEPRPRTFERELAAYERDTRAEGDAHFTIYDRATWRPIGTTHLFGLDFRNGRAEFGILIGEGAYRGRGYGTETTRLMLDYAFTALGLHNVYLTVNAYNAAGLRAYAKAGFREFGRRRECKTMGGRRWDVVYMDCLATEFVSPVLATIFTPEATVPGDPSARRD